MAKLNEQFKTFLSNINPDNRAVLYAQKAHKPVRECLDSHDKFKEFVEGSFLYGSYRRRTAVGDIKDVDIVILTNFDLDDEENTPQSVLRRLKAALGRCYDDPENPQYQRRSIRIEDPLPDYEVTTMTLDIIPAVRKTNKNGPLFVPDIDVQKWVMSHPKGHLRRTKALNKASNGQFVPLVKMMKWWWQYQCEIRQPEVERPKPKGFWIECLVAEIFDPTQRLWADRFISVLENIANNYEGVDDVPLLADPGIQAETIKTSMTFEEFKVFLDASARSLDLARTARDTQDPTESSVLWREIFGESFPLHDPDETDETREVATTIPISDTSHAQSLPWPLNIQKQNKVHLDAFLYSDGSKRLSGINSNGRVVSNGLRVKYLAIFRKDDSCDIYWRVVNTGRHATQDNGLRGEFFLAKDIDGTRSSDQSINWEVTQYTGKHWIECFMVKDGECVGRSKKFFVNIRNPNFP